MAVKLSVLRTGRLQPPPQEDSWYSFMLYLSRPQGHSAAGGILKLVDFKNEELRELFNKTVSCIIYLCSSIEVHQCFGGRFHLHLQSRRVNQLNRVMYYFRDVTAYSM
jgi:hypothetical protein